VQYILRAEAFVDIGEGDFCSHAENSNEVIR
jgi:hypothetical protein